MKITSKKHKKAANFVKNNPDNFMCIPLNSAKNLFYPSNGILHQKTLSAGTMLYIQKVFANSSIYSAEKFMNPVPPHSYIVVNGTILWLPSNSSIV